MEQREFSMTVDKDGARKAVQLRLRDSVRRMAPEPEVLRLLGEESKQRGTDKLTGAQIDEIIGAARAARRKRKAG